MTNFHFPVKTRDFFRVFTIFSFLLLCLSATTSCKQTELELEEFNESAYTILGDFGSFQNVNSLNTNISRLHGKFYLSQMHGQNLIHYGINDTLKSSVAPLFKLAPEISQFDEYYNLHDSLLIFSKHKSNEVFFYNLFTEEVSIFRINIADELGIRGTYTSRLSDVVFINQNEIAFPFTKSLKPNTSLATIYEGNTNIGIVSLGVNNAVLKHLIGSYPQKYLTNDYREHAVNFTILDANSYAISFSKSADVFIYDLKSHELKEAIKLEPQYNFSSLNYKNPSRKSEVESAENSALLFGLKNINARYAARFVSNNPEKRLELLIYDKSDWQIAKRYTAQNVLPAMYIFNNKLFLIKKVNETIKLVQLKEDF